MSIDAGILGSIKKLRAKFSGSDVHPDATKQIDEWEKRILELSRIDNFANLDTTKAVTQQIHRRYKDVIMQKAFKKGLTAEEIRSFDQDIETLSWVLKLFRPNYESEIEEIKKAIEFELEP